jgi:hypothetical protein
LSTFLGASYKSWYRHVHHSVEQAEGGAKMLMRTDPFRELDRLTEQALGTAARPAAMPMDAKPRKIAITGGTSARKQVSSG